MASDALQPFREVRSAFKQVEISREKAGLSFDVHAVTIGPKTKSRVVELISGKESKPLGRFAKLLLSGQLGPRTQHILFHILFVQLSFKPKLKDMRADIMAIFEDPNITSAIERNPMAYFSLFGEDGRNDPPLATALEALRQCAHE